MLIGLWKEFLDARRRQPGTHPAGALLHIGKCVVAGVINWGVPAGRAPHGARWLGPRVARGCEVGVLGGAVAGREEQAQVAAGGRVGKGDKSVVVVHSRGRVAGLQAPFQSQLPCTDLWHSSFQLTCTTRPSLFSANACMHKRGMASPGSRIGKGCEPASMPGCRKVSWTPTWQARNSNWQPCAAKHLCQTRSVLPSVRGCFQSACLCTPTPCIMHFRLTIIQEESSPPGPLGWPAMMQVAFCAF